MSSNVEFKTGDVIVVNIPNGIGHQQKGIRAAVIVSNNIGNKKSPMLEILPGTTKRNNSTLPTHAHFVAGECGLKEDTVFEAESKWTINKYQVIKKIGKMNDDQLERIAMAMVYAVPIVQIAFTKGIQHEEKFQRVATAY